MKRFIKNLLTKICLLSFALVATNILIRSQIHCIINSKKYKNIILGDSHTDFIYSPEFLNLSLQGSPYSIWKSYLEQIDIENKNIFISISPVNFSDLYQSRFDNPELDIGWFQRYHKEFQSFMNWLSTKQKVMPIHVLIHWWKEFSPLTKQHFQNQSLVGGDRLNSTIKKHFYTKKSEDVVQIQSFMDLIHYLKIRGANEVILVEMPMTNNYINNIPEPMIKKYDSILKSSGCRRLKVTVSNSDLFYDDDHIKAQYQNQVFFGELMTYE